MPTEAGARVLSYHDVLLRKGDVDLLRGPHWLNDQIIAFYFEYLLREVHPRMSEAVALVPGAMSFLLLNSDPSEATVIFEALQLHKKDLVVFAVNDNPDVEWAAGGAHWSCLAYHRFSNTFRHYDSAKPHNTQVARALAGAAAPLVRSTIATACDSNTGQANSCCSSQATGSSSKYNSMFPSFVEADTPQQQNSSDCGMYVLAVTQALSSSLAQSQAQNMVATTNSSSATVFDLSEQQEAELLQRITPAAVINMRDEILKIIGSLSAGPA